jgi:hypothetical protein
VVVYLSRDPEVTMGRLKTEFYSLQLVEWTVERAEDSTKSECHHSSTN